MRVFPLSNWAERDIWEYIKLEQIPIVPIYFALKRDVIIHNGILIPVSSDFTGDRKKNKNSSVPIPQPGLHSLHGSHRVCGNND